jgi:pimeloyl-ACP methyl ester carboxylesterase
LEIISPKILNLLNKSSVCVKNINTLLILGKDDTVVPSYSTLYYFRNINKKINYEIFDTNHNPFREKSAEFIETINKFIEQNNK